VPWGLTSHPPLPPTTALTYARQGQQLRFIPSHMVLLAAPPTTTHPSTYVTFVPPHFTPHPSCATLPPLHNT